MVRLGPPPRGPVHGRARHRDRERRTSSIQTDLGFSQENLQWVVSAYALLFGGFLLLGGRVADLHGRQRLFVAGIIVFTLASLVSGLAWGQASLIRARAPLQGLGAALITPAALSILTDQFAEARAERRASVPGAASARSARWRACCSAACSPTRSAGSGSSSSTCRSGCSPRAGAHPPDRAATRT